MAKNKFGAISVTRGGKKFPSRLEAAVYDILVLREKSGEISKIACQYDLLLKKKCSECGDGPVRWKVDFSFIDNRSGERCFAEAKGVEGPAYRLRKKLFKRNRPGRLEVWKGTWKNPKLVEVIE